MRAFYCYPIAGFGIIFFAPMIVQALVSGKGLDVSTLHSSKKLMTAHTTRVKDAGAGDSVRGLMSFASRQLLGGGAAPATPPAGIKAALLTSVPFGLAAMSTLYVAHRWVCNNEL